MANGAAAVARLSTKRPDKYMKNRKISYKVRVRDRLSSKPDNRVATGGSHGTAEQAALTRAKLLRTSERYFEL